MKYSAADVQLLRALVAERARLVAERKRITQELRGLTNRDLAEKFEMPVSTVREIAMGRRR